MRSYFSTQPLYNLLSPPINSRFAVALTGISESSGTPSGDGFHNPNPPIYQDFCCRLFDSRLSCPLPCCNDAVDLGDLRSRLLQMHHPLVTPITAAA